MFFGALESSCTGVPGWSDQVPVKSRCKQKGVFHVFLENKLTDSYRVVTISMCIMGDVQIHWNYRVCCDNL